MALLQATPFGERLPTQVEQEDAARLRSIMDATRSTSGAYRFVLRNSEQSEPQEVHLDQAVGDALRGFLEIIAKGQSVQIVPIEAELSTKQAAAILNVSRPFLIKLLDEKQIPHRKVGQHRRVRAEDLFEYKARQDQVRLRVLGELLKADEADDRF